MGWSARPEQWFRRYNAAEPEQGGARKTEALKPKAWLAETPRSVGGADQPGPGAGRPRHPDRPP